MTRHFFFALALMLTAGPALAAMDHSQHHAMATPNKDIYAPAMDKMMADMPAPLGDADADFMRQMIVHHQAAIDMADAALKQAKDPEVRALATNILSAQKSEIAGMQQWLKTRNIPVK